MPQSSAHHASALSVALAPATVNGQVGLGTFMRGVLDYLLSLARSAVDTEEERDAIVDAVLSVADKLVAPRFPVGWAVIRESVRSFADDAIDKLPELLGG